ncbi:glucans biosynthesis glucosyltransferase MdoH [Rhodoligotrophos defluvii]|uniref:glucans biosynthesis glucosyltransferase MdoH n=1 Tax=Rhodoligotrophos defluvii TaxID=2561934 RepID=UPI001485B569|nr:glucans biosynthesis glucosyltransferase MdoH [Rhodoligotrophos defluvii]
MTSNAAAIAGGLDYLDDPLVPPERPLLMPVQSSTRSSRRMGRARPRPDTGTLVSRLFVATTTFALTAIATYEMINVVAVTEVSWLQGVFAALFAVTFLWIALPCASAMLGFLHLVRKSGREPPQLSPGPLGRNVLVMPVYNEDPTRTCLALEAMGRDLDANGAADNFEIFILSDTRDEAIARQEEIAIRNLRRALGPDLTVYYRRRALNTGRKAGNIADFVRRWGGRYDHMVVLDADSMMSAETLIYLARAMALDPRAGIIQTVPMLAGRSTLFARMQQFATRIYGPIIAEGLAAWHGRESNFWGHNAIIRTRAFAQSAGLPELSGRKPFGGHIMSHDFVEAALMVRAGWSVYMVPELKGSYEECPPSLIDLAGRDRRWAQGNLQHIKVIGAKKLALMSRIHLLVGIMSYLASPLWLAMIAIGLALATQAHFTHPDYFPEGFNLFPRWPVFDSERALQLFTFTMGVLLLPKVLGVLAALLNPAERQACGGGLAVVLGMVAETLLSALIAPVMMLLQTRWVMEIVMGRDSGWNAQRRDDGSLPFSTIFGNHYGQMLFGAVMAAAAYTVSVDTFLWLSPVTIGLVLAPLLSWLTAQVSAGIAFRRARLFLIPEEVPAQA